MMLPHRWKALSAGLLLAATAIVAPSIARAETVLRTVLGADLRGLMPGISAAVSTSEVLQHIYEGLVAWRSDGTVAPMLAEKIDTSPDGLTYTFTLRPGIHFHNGAPLTAKDVVWTWQRFLDPKMGWPCRTNFDGTRQIKITNIEAIDDLHVAFHLAKPSKVLLTQMARLDCDSTGIAHSDSVDATGTWSKAIGTGPFKLDEWRKGQFVELSKYEGYVSRTEKTDGLAGGKQALLDKLRFVIIPDMTAASVAVQSGDMDIFPDLDPTQTKPFEGNPAVKMLSVQTAGINAILMEPNDPLLQDPRIRRAIGAALDTEAMRDGLTAGTAKFGSSLVPPTSAYYGPVEKQGLRYDPEAAKKLLAEAGYHGQKLTITTTTQFSSTHDSAILAQAMLQAVGIDAAVEDVDFGNMMERFLKGRYQLIIWNAAAYLDPILAFDRFIGDNAHEPEKNWSDPKAIALLSKLFDTSADERQPLYDDLQRLYVEDAPMVVWCARVSVAAMRNAVQGYEPWPGMRPRFWNVSLKP